MAAMQIVRIGDGSTELPSIEMVGAKAANLARMAAFGLPVPPAFVLPVDLCEAIVRNDPLAKQQLAKGLAEGIAFLEGITSRRFGDRRYPMLVSVRSGAARSMPGMLDTVLDVGCTSVAVHGLVRMSGHPRFAWDCRRRFLESYASVVLGIDLTRFAKLLGDMVSAERVDNALALDGEAMERLAVNYQQIIEDDDYTVSEDAMEQLESAARAVYRSWMSDRACTYRQLQHLEDLRGTAVTVQAMVFGNHGIASGAGVAFSRDPSTGAAAPMIDVLFESQGEDVVSGTCNPETEDAIRRSIPAIAAQLRDALRRLEREFADVQDVEFTIEDGKLWILQTRAAKRTPYAAMQFAIDFVREGLITAEEALRRLDGLDLNAIAAKQLIDVGEPIEIGTGASTGVTIGRAAFDTPSAERLATSGDPVILVRPDASTADVAGFAVSDGILTASGGRTAHAALVARQMGKPCIVGCVALLMDTDNHSAKIGNTQIREGDWLSIDGGSGKIYLGRGKVVVNRPEIQLAEIERWRTETRVHSG
jgi:pyruvate,orthophosphate dikinase